MSKAENIISAVNQKDKGTLDVVAKEFDSELYVCVVSLFALESLNAGNWRAMTIWSTVPALLSMLMSIPFLDDCLFLDNGMKLSSILSSQETTHGILKFLKLLKNIKSN